MTDYTARFVKDEPNNDIILKVDPDGQFNTDLDGYVVSGKLSTKPGESPMLFVEYGEYSSNDLDKIIAIITALRNTIV